MTKFVHKYSKDYDIFMKETFDSLPSKHMPKIKRIEKTEPNEIDKAEDDIPQVECI